MSTKPLTLKTTAFLTLGALSLTGAGYLGATSNSSATATSTVSQTAGANTQAAGTTLPTSQTAPTDTGSSPSNTVQGQQFSVVAKQIWNWAKKQGGAVWNSLKQAVADGWQAVSQWIKDKLPGHLRDAAIALGLEELAKWIVANWPF